MKIDTLHCVVTEYIPEVIKDGVLYYAPSFNVAIHNCCCGCKSEVVTTISPAEWSIDIINGKPTLYPSIGNWSYRCKSHYWIRDGKIVWSGNMSESEIARSRNFRKLAQERMSSERNVNSRVETRPRMYQKFVNWIKSLINSER